MILKASQRGGGKQLGLHLTRTDDNDHVELHEIRGFLSDDIVSALKEAHAVSRGTRCKQFLFSVSLNPPPQERVDVETFESAIARIEERTGLAGHPRMIVFHEKEGRRHAHAVWSRIDADTMTAKNLPFFKMKLRDLSRELYIENGWKMPRGLMNSREADPRNFTLAEWHQAKRAGYHARDLKSILQECWAVSDSKAAFMQALKSQGFTLAKGDRRAHIALSPEGEVFSVARATGKKAKEIQARLGPPDDLPCIQDARARLAQELGKTFLRLRREAQSQKQRDLAPLEAERRAMAQGQRLERSQLKQKQQARWAIEVRARADRFDKGIKGLWSAITGKHAEVRRGNEREAYAALARDRAQRQTLIDAQMKDRQALQARIKSAREHHAALLRGLRADQQAVLQRTQEATRTSRTTKQRLDRARSGERPSKCERSHDKDRER